MIPALIRKCVDASDAASPTIEVLGRRHADPRVPLRRGRAPRGSCWRPKRYDGADPVNLGAGFEISIRDLAALIAELTGFPGRIVWDTTKPNGQPRRCLDIQPRRERFGFRARTDFRTGLRDTIDWYVQKVRGGA